MLEEMKKMRTLMLRLEAAVTRIEDVADHYPNSTEASAVVPPVQAANSSETTLRGSSPTQELSLAVTPPILEAFDHIKDEALVRFVSLSSQIGQPVVAQAQFVREAFDAQRTLISTASLCRNPGEQRFSIALQPLQAILTNLINVKEKNRGSQFFNHLSTVADGMSAAGWVAINIKPAQYVAEMRDSAQFYGNRVIKEYKEKDLKHKEWVQSFLKLLEQLQEYVREFHTTGMSWDEKGKEFETIWAAATEQQPNTSASTAAASSSLPPPPPGPPPPPSLPEIREDSATPESAKGDMNSVFADLNKGSAVTSGLRKVDKSQMTHKNPSLRNTTAVSSTNKPATSAVVPSQGPPRAKKAPRLELEGTKWIVEHYENDQNILIDSVELHQTVYVYNCKNSTLQIKGKLNAISLDCCTKTGVVVDSLVSSIDVVKTNSFALQVMGVCPTIVCDVCDSGQIYLSRDGLDCEIVTSKCGSININVPGEDGQFREESVPEMLKHKIVNGKLETSIVIHAD